MTTPPKWTKELYQRMASPPATELAVPPGYAIVLGPKLGCYADWSVWHENQLMGRFYNKAECHDWIRRHEKFHATHTAATLSAGPL